MLQSFIIVLREGFESFILVAIILSYLRKTGQKWLGPAVYSAIAVSVAVSAALGFELMQGVNESLWEGVLGIVAIVMVGSLVIHMWRTAPRLRKRMEKRLRDEVGRRSRIAAFSGVFLFTVLMISREGMETALMLMQVRQGRLISGAILGLIAAAALAWSWTRFGQLINVRRFFQVTGIFLLLFMVQVGIYSFHEFSEAGLLPNSEAIHTATEAFSPTGTYGQWFSLLMLFICAMWLVGAYLADRLRASRERSVSIEHV